jgi:hypothetical protein
MVEGKMSIPQELQTGMPPGSHLAPTMYGLYINFNPQTLGVHLVADDRCIYTTDHKEGYVLRKVQHGFTSSMDLWCGH